MTSKMMKMILLSGEDSNQEKIKKLKKILKEYVNDCNIAIEYCVTHPEEKIDKFKKLVVDFQTFANMVINFLERKSELFNLVSNLFISLLEKCIEECKSFPLVSEITELEKKAAELITALNTNIK